MATLPVVWEDNRPLVSVTVNGQEARALVDTGATTSSFFRNGADALGLNYTIVAGATTHGLGGAARVYSARVNELTVGGTTANDLSLRVLDYNWRGNQSVAMILGQNLLATDNLELDFTAARLTFYRTRGDCERTALAYWSEDWSVIDMLPGRDHGHVRVNVMLNGQTVRALFDTGAPTSVVTRDIATRLGITTESPEVVQAGTSTGIGRRSVDAWLGRFDTFAIGEELVANARLRIIDTGALPGASGVNFDILLGADFFRSHRVMFAYSQRKVYFVHLGGRVFQAAAPSNCPTRKRRSAGPESLGVSRCARGDARL